MTCHSILAAAALVFAGVVAGAAISYSGSAISQSGTRTYIALGTHASGSNASQSNAWFIDANDRSIILCVAGGGSNKPSCTTTPLP